MSKRARHREGPPTRRGGMRTGVVLAIAVVVLGGGAAWLFSSSPHEAAARTPRLAVDRTEVDLGYRRFDSIARVVFTLTNAGDGPLRLAEVPRVKVVQGC